MTPTRHITEVKQPEKVDRTLLLARLSAEVDALAKISSGLQDAIHNLPLNHSDGGTRKSLQSADKLSQSLTCLAAAISALSRQPPEALACDPTEVFESVFLEDIRRRLSYGADLMEPREGLHEGEVEIF